MSPRRRSMLAILLGAAAGTAAMIAILSWTGTGTARPGPEPRTAPSAAAANPAPPPAPTPAAPVPAAVLRVVGRVVDELAEPVRGCPLLLEPSRTADWLAPAEAAATAIEARTGVDGRFAIDATGAGPFTLLLTADRFPTRVAATGIDGAPGTRVDLGDLVLTSAVGLVVEVRAAGSGRPLADARVTLEPEVVDPWLGAASRQQQRRQARADAEGLATLYGVEPGAWQLRVAAAGRATRVLLHEQPAAVTSVRRRVDLAPGFALRGVVAAPDGTPVAAARIVAWPPRPGGDDRPDPVATAETASNGSFRLEGLASGPLLLRVESDAWPPLDAQLAEVASAGPLQLRLAPGGRVRGAVRADGRPLAGARVEALPEAGPVARAGGFVRFVATTDADGGFDLAGLPPGACRLRVSAPGRRTHTTPALDPHLADPPPLQIALGAASRLSGRILDEAGRPLADARVAITTPPSRADGLARFALHPALRQPAPTAVQTDVDGAFALPVTEPEGVAVGVEVVVADRPPRIFGPFPAPPAGAEDRIPDLVAGPGSTLHGRLVDAAGRGRAGQRVTLLPRGEPVGRRPHTVVTDADGGFVVQPLAGGGWTVLGAFRVVDGGSPNFVLPEDRAELRMSWEVE